MDGQQDEYLENKNISVEYLSGIEGLWTLHLFVMVTVNTWWITKRTKTDFLGEAGQYTMTNV